MSRITSASTRNNFPPCFKLSGVAGVDVRFSKINSTKVSLEDSVKRPLLTNKGGVSSLNPYSFLAVNASKCESR